MQIFFLIVILLIGVAEPLFSADFYNTSKKPTSCEYTMLPVTVTLDNGIVIERLKNGGVVYKEDYVSRGGTALVYKGVQLGGYYNNVDFFCAVTQFGAIKKIQFHE